MKTIKQYLDSLEIPYEERKPNKTVQLALDIDDINNAQRKRMVSEYMLFDKLDGVYSFIVCIPEGSQWRIKRFSRTGKSQPGCEHLNEKLRVALEDSEVKPFSFILISEITAPGHLAKLSGYLNPNRKDSRDPLEGMEDNFHDMLSLAEFCEGVADRSAFLRYTMLENLMAQLHMLDTVITNFRGSYETSLEFFEEVQLTGGEGIIMRDPDAVWEAGKRDERQMKMKEKIDFDCQVVGYCTGKEGSKYETCIGKLLVAFRAHGKPDGELILLPVGSGLTDRERIEFYGDPQKVLGTIWKVKAKSFTEFGNLREPVLEEQRHDKTVANFQCEKGDWKVYTKAKCTWSHFEIS